MLVHIKCPKKCLACLLEHLNKKYRKMEIIELEQALKARYNDLNMIYAYAEKSYFYNPQNILPRGAYFATFKEADGQNDKASMLGRDKVYRLSFGICTNSYFKIFGTKPKRPLKGHIVDLEHNFTELNTLTPHPIYAWMNWV